MKLKDEIVETERHGVDEAKQTKPRSWASGPESGLNSVPSEFAGILTYVTTRASRAFPPQTVESVYPRVSNTIPES